VSAFAKQRLGDAGLYCVIVTAHVLVLNGGYNE
jgi:hypothetical protein